MNYRIRKARDEAQTLGDGGNLAYIGALERQLTASENDAILLRTVKDELEYRLSTLEHERDALEEELDSTTR